MMHMVSKANKEVVDPEADVERDQRTVYVSGIPLRASKEEVNIFFSNVCKVRNIDLILDLSLRVPKAVGYIEFDDPIYVSMAVDLFGQLLLGQPIKWFETRRLDITGPISSLLRAYHAHDPIIPMTSRYLLRGCNSKKSLKSMEVALLRRGTEAAEFISVPRKNRYDTSLSNLRRLLQLD
ncbi:hypothetical protein RHSIM_Rhsim03G0117900 [Rhododendron simsii]|uniref:RRM domain-containing protein n=1 Tax=Rhododendron simsii TaxID=118357 RepID=A0A834LUA5_RHOSS|nr:hypothetical protein RHSIM_Rhsim03G0117900 [Rhododendron simsii]